MSSVQIHVWSMYFLEDISVKINDRLTRRGGLCESLGDTSYMYKYVLTKYWAHKISIQMPVKVICMYEVS